MSTLYGTSIVKNGLVLYYDMSNTQKSWQGAPATNEIVNIVYGFDYSGTTITPVTNNSLTYNGFTTHSMVNTTSSFNCYISGGNLNAASLSTVWTFSAYIRRADNLPISSLTVYIYATINGVYTGNIVDAGNGWYLIYYTASGTNVAAGLVGFTGLLQNVTYYVSAPMLSKTTVPVPPLAVQQTRSTTQAILDLTKINTLTANSLTYASDNTFSYNGTSNSLTVPFNSTNFTFNAEQTIIIWMKNQSPSTARRNPYNQAYAGAGTITHENDTNFNYYYGTQGGNGTPYTSHTSPFSVVVGETAMICITRNTSQSAWYKNGVLGTAQSNPYGVIVTGTLDITIGSGYAGYFGGSIYVVQVYNRALSAAEVTQNFNALRTRYGL